VPPPPALRANGTLQHRGERSEGGGGVDAAGTAVGGKRLRREESSMEEAEGEQKRSAWRDGAAREAPAAAGRDAAAARLVEVLARLARDGEAAAAAAVPLGRALRRKSRRLPARDEQGAPEEREFSAYVAAVPPPLPSY
jgi:hypothetical protein